MGPTDDEYESVHLHRGSAVVIYPGTWHTLRNYNSSASSCRLLFTLQESGPFPKGNAEKHLKSRFVSTDASTLPPVKTAHESSLLSKKVFLSNGHVPGLFQVSLARFALNAECEEHRHRSAAEVYVNYDGDGCYLKVEDEDGQPHEYNLSGRKVAVINAGVLHSAWNHGTGPCQNINLMIGPPWE
eukprot:TRINITY_DN24869_c0_g1_i1.p1 TRINITY_DN24869_c0_g1~~TRINITY_DN24869_c0_g1_i1.p1  ORF type:complete len:185 (+),score=33.19 TRINITY_DN24869_c0_g1_i1:244-798(+)